MQLSNLSYAEWLLTAGLEIFVCALAYRRGLYRRLPLFTAYLTVSVASTVFMWIVYREFGFGSQIAYNVAWITQAILLVARGFAIAELCFCLLRAYPGIWALSWRILLAAAFLFLLHAALESAARPYWRNTFVLALDRDLELAATGILIVLLLIGRYYQLELDPLERQIAAGLCLYSMAHVITNGVMVQAAAAHFLNWVGYYYGQMGQVATWWNSARALSGYCAMIIWALALRQPFPAVRPAPELLPPSAYRELSPAINFKLRALNTRLLQLLKD
jgi:hypothetical protein